jgi:ATP-dependent RNA helicase SUPV3L1/SUV3
VKPPGALDGSGFTITGTMTSLVGASGEDFASVLRSLGYRMERRPKPPEAVPELKTEVTLDAGAEGGVGESAAASTPDAVEIQPENVETEPQAGNEATTQSAQNKDGAATAVLEFAEAVQPADALAGSEASSREEQDPYRVQSIEQEIAAEPPSAADEFVEPYREESEQAGSDVATEVVQGATAEPIADGTAEQPPEFTPEQPEQTAEQAADVAAEPVEAAPAEPELIEVWRPGRFDRPARSHGPRRRERHDGRRPHRGARPADASAPQSDTPSAGTANAETASAKPDDAQSDRRPHRQRFQRPQRSEHPHRAPGGERQERSDRGERGDRDGRPPRPQRFDRSARSEGGSKPFNKASAPPRRDREPDPNSPFAKLAALKEQLEADAKERR